MRVCRRRAARVPAGRLTGWLQLSQGDNWLVAWISWLLDYIEGKVIRFADGLDFGYKKGVVKGDAGVSDLNYQKDGFARTEIENAVAGTN